MGISSWWKSIRKKGLLLIIWGIVWLIWQLLIDDFCQLARNYIPEGGVLMWAIIHPYYIMPFLLIVFGVWLSIKKISESERSFTKEDAFRIYSRVSELIRDLRETTEIVNKENVGKQNKYDLLFKDRRVVNIVDEIEKTREECKDREFDKMLGDLLAFERRLATYSISAYGGRRPELLEIAHQSIRRYINKKFKSHKNGKHTN